MPPSRRGPPRAAPAPRRWRAAIPAAALTLASLALYGRVATFGYVQADDTDLVRDNQAFLADLGNAPEAFTRSYFEVAGRRADRKTYYRPVVTLSLMLDAQVGGPEPGAYHVTNLAIHAGSVLLLFALLRTLGTAVLPSFLLALLFAVHPANTQAVCWIPGRNDTLLAAFGLASLIGLARWLSGAGGRWLWLHVGGFAAALFTKESALALLPLFALFAAVPARRVRDLLSRRLVLVSYAVVVLGWYLLRRAALAGDGDGLSGRESLVAIARNVPDLLLYVGKAVLPVNLNVMPGLTAAGAVLGAVALGLLVWAFARFLEPRTRLLVSAWFLLFVVPALLVPGLPAYEHRLYFPLAGLIVGVSQFRIRPAGDPRRTRWLAGTLAVHALFAALAFTHAGVFRDRYTYWSNATEGTPYAGLAHVNLGQLYEADGDPARAGEQYRLALARDPATPGAHNNLGVLAARRGDLDGAAVHLEAEIARHPANADAHYNLGLVQRLAGRIDDAVPHWQRAIDADPYYAPAYRALADYYGERGDTARAQMFLDRLRLLETRGGR